MDRDYLLNVARACGRPSNAVEQLKRTRDGADQFADDEVQKALRTETNIFPLAFIAAYFGVADALCYLQRPEKEIEGWNVEALCVIPGPPKEEIEKAQRAVRDAERIKKQEAKDKGEQTDHDHKEGDEDEMDEIGEKDICRLLSVAHTIDPGQEKGQFMSRCFFREETIEPLQRCMEKYSVAEVKRIVAQVAATGFCNHASYESTKLLSSGFIKHGIPLQLLFDHGALPLDTPAFAGIVAGTLGTDEVADAINLLTKNGLTEQLELNLGNEKVTISELTRRYGDSVAIGAIRGESGKNLKPKAPAGSQPADGRPRKVKSAEETAEVATSEQSTVDPGQDPDAELRSPTAPISPKAKAASNPKTNQVKGKASSTGKTKGLEQGVSDECLNTAAASLVQQYCVDAVEIRDPARDLLQSYYKIAVTSP